MTQQNSAELLLPCPFCGGEPVRIEVDKIIASHIQCSVCKIKTPRRTRYGDAIELWNKRTPAPRQECASVDLLSKAIKILEDHNRWRRGAEDLEMCSPKILGDAIEICIEAAKAYLANHSEDKRDMVSQISECKKHVVINGGTNDIQYSGNKFYQVKTEYQRPSEE